jgi:hypothetical protein
MSFAEPLRETLEEDSQDVAENERTPTPIWEFLMRPPSAGPSIRETAHF